MIVAINDEQETSMMVEHQASRGAELAIGFAMLLGANRELDSSIGIKRMIAHLPKINLSLSLSLSLNDKEMRHEARECEQERQREQRERERRDEQTTKEQRTALPLSLAQPHEPTCCQSLDLSTERYPSKQRVQARERSLTTISHMIIRFHERSRKRSERVAHDGWLLASSTTMRHT